jgi:hypothetical protein
MRDFLAAASICIFRDAYVVRPDSIENQSLRDHVDGLGESAREMALEAASFSSPFNSPRVIFDGKVGIVGLTARHVDVHEGMTSKMDYVPTRDNLVAGGSISVQNIAAALDLSYSLFYNLSRRNFYVQILIGGSYA